MTKIVWQGYSFIHDQHQQEIILTELHVEEMHLAHAAWPFLCFTRTLRPLQPPLQKRLKPNLEGAILPPLALKVHDTVDIRVVTEYF